MATVDQVERTILAVAGNPSSGAIKALAREMAERIVALDSHPAKGTRAVETRETR